MSRFKKFDLTRIRSNARELRKNMTDSEKLLWQEIKDRKLNGYKFLRQHPILYKGDLIRYNYFIADFYCYETHMIDQSQTRMNIIHFQSCVVPSDL